ncbi:MAG: hypothetical protein QX196_00155 [Methylococcaceae bacterium]
MQENRQFTDEYINDHWRELLMTSLSSYDEAYTKAINTRKTAEVMTTSSHAPAQKHNPQRSNVAVEI